MTSSIPLIFLNLFALYVLLGLFFSIIYIWKGAHVVDSGAEGAGLFFKLLILPGTIIFWPVFLIKWFKKIKQ